MLVKDFIEQLKTLPEHYSIVLESGWDTVSQYPSSWDTVEVDIHQLDEFEEIVLTPLPLG
jgi:hypothetical protein